MDEIGRSYLVLALWGGELEDGYVDSYYGPPELRDEARARTGGPGQLLSEARSLQGQLEADVADPQRRRWLDRQLVAIQTLARRLDGEEIPYVREVELCFDAAPAPTPPEAYSGLRRLLDDLLPAGPSIHERLEARDARLTIPVERVAAILDWVVAEMRSLCAASFPIPAGESLTVSLVNDEPWAAYNWYEGNLSSRIEVNLDLPTRAHHLVPLVGHETFPGHHLEHAWKEQRLVRDRGQVEASVQLINTPEAYISEGLGEVGPALLVDAQKWQELLVQICDRAGIALTSPDAAREWDIAQALRTLRGSSGDAALQLHAESRPREAVLQFLVDEALRTPEQAYKTLEFITHPLWRTYVFCYAGGEKLLTQWTREAGDPAAQRDRFLRLLTEELTPSGIAEELQAA
jgi:hypothetical protein